MSTPDGTKKPPVYAPGIRHLPLESVVHHLRLVGDGIATEYRVDLNKFEATPPFNELKLATQVQAGWLDAIPPGMHDPVIEHEQLVFRFDVPVEKKLYPVDVFFLFGSD